VIAVVGPTGAGKTTLVSLLPRFYDANHGAILLDEADMRRLTLEPLRRAISVVLRERLLFSVSVAGNLRCVKLWCTSSHCSWLYTENNARWHGRGCRRSESAQVESPRT